MEAGKVRERTPAGARGGSAVPQAVPRVALPRRALASLLRPAPKPGSGLRQLLGLQLAGDTSQPSAGAVHPWGWGRGRADPAPRSAHGSCVGSGWGCTPCIRGEGLNPRHLGAPGVATPQDHPTSSCFQKLGLQMSIWGHARSPGVPWGGAAPPGTPPAPINLGMQQLRQPWSRGIDAFSRLRAGRGGAHTAPRGRGG